MKRSESDILDVYIRGIIQNHNAKVYCEVRVGDLGIADAVAILPNGESVIIEGKASKLSYKLLSQCLRWNTFGSHIVAVVPEYERDGDDSEGAIATAHFTKNKIGIHGVKDGRSFPCNISHTWWNGEFDPEIKKFLRDSQLYEDGRFAKAGQSSGRRASKANEEYAGIETYVAQNPGCSAAECAREGGMKASALLKLIKQGKVRLAVENKMGKTYVSPL